MYVSGKFHVYTTGDTVDCAGFDAISPLTDLMHRIVELSDYDGFGCINFKFAPNRCVHSGLLVVLFQLSHLTCVLHQNNAK